MQVASSVYRVTVGDFHNNIYLVRGHRAAFIDAGYHDDDHLRAILEMWDLAGRPEISAVVVSHSHPDHSGGASKLASATGSPIVSTAAEKPDIERGNPGTRVSHTVTDTETLDLGTATLEFVHTPGHTPGSLSVYYSEEGILFAGDTIRNYEGFEVEDMGAHLDSLRKLLNHDLKLIGPGHGPMVEEPRAYIERQLIELGPRAAGPL